MTQTGSRRSLQHIWITGREYVTHWAIAGCVVALTGFAPDHWVGHLIQHMPDAFRHLPAIDYRLVVVCVGVAIVAGDILLRSRKRAATGAPGPQAAAEPAAASPAQPLPDKPSIAVLPFSNIGGDPEQEYFADGISEDIISAVSKLRWFFVIARNSSFVYKGKAVDVKSVARELGVRYVLEGSVRKSGNSLRITAQLIDASTGNQMWSDRYDGELTDIFALQDEISRKVVAAIEPRLIEAEGLRSHSRSPDDIRAWDMAMQANHQFWRMTKTDGEAAIAILQRAVERHPDYAPAHSMLAFMLLLQGYLGFMPPQMERAAKLAARAAELDGSDPSAHLALGFLAYSARRTAEAVEEFQRALDLNPNFAAAHGYLGWALAFDGQSDRAIAHLQDAIRLSPHARKTPSSTAGWRRRISSRTGTPRPSPLPASRCSSAPASPAFTAC